MVRSKSKMLYITAVSLFGLFLVAFVLWGAFTKDIWDAKADTLDSQYVGSPISFQSWTGNDSSSDNTSLPTRAGSANGMQNPQRVNFFPTYSFSVSLSTTLPDGAVREPGDGHIPLWFKLDTFSITRWQYDDGSRLFTSPMSADPQKYASVWKNVYDSYDDFYRVQKPASTWYQLNNFAATSRLLAVSFPRVTVNSTSVRPTAFVYADCYNPQNIPLSQVNFTFPKTVGFGTGSSFTGGYSYDNFTIRYTYNDGFYVAFTILLPYYNTEVYADIYRLSVPFRTYYLLDPDGDEYHAGFGAGYTEGWNAGHDAAYDEAHRGAYVDGYNTGITAGYNKGYNDGVAKSNDYTFVRLLTAVVDAPIQAFSGLMDFTVLGVNMKSFYLSLLTACVMICMCKILF